MAFSFRAKCPIGLEGILRNEVTKFLPSATHNVRVAPGVVKFSFSESTSSLQTNPLDKVLGTLCLNSHVSTGVFLELGAPFRAEWEKQASDGLNRIPWNICFRSWSDVRDISVKSSKSRLFASDHLSDLAKQSLSNFHGRNKSSLFHDSGDHVTAGLRIQVENNMMTVLVDGSGENMGRIEPEKFTSRFRLDVTESIAAGCTIKSFGRVVEKMSEPSMVWDPFSGSGVLPLTAARTLAGVPPGSPAIPYPFRYFPTHDRATFDSVCSELNLEPHPNVHFISEIVMSESSKDAFKIMESNIVRFHQSLPSLDDQSVIPFPIGMERKPDAYIPPKDGKIAILTALPCGDDSARICLKFHDMLESLQERLVGCVVLTSKPEEFKRLSKRKWLSDLRIFDGRRFIECLYLVQE